MYFNILILPSLSDASYSECLTNILVSAGYSKDQIIRMPDLLKPELVKDILETDKTLVLEDFLLLSQWVEHRQPRPQEQYYAYSHLAEQIKDKKGYYRIRVLEAAKKASLGNCDGVRIDFDTFLSALERSEWAKAAESETKRLMSLIVKEGAFLAPIVYADAYDYL